MMNRVMLWLAAFILAAAGTPNAIADPITPCTGTSVPCVDPNNPSHLYWANDCNNPTIYVEYDGVEAAAFCQDLVTGFWTIILETAPPHGAQNFVVIKILATTPGVNIEEIRIDKGENSAAGIAILSLGEIDNFSAGIYRFNHIRSVRRGAQLEELYVGGSISGDLGELGVNATPNVTGIGDDKIGAGLAGLAVDGYVLGDVILSTNDESLFSTSSQLKRLECVGSVFGAIDAPSGGINVIEVGESLGTPTSPVVIRSYIIHRRNYGWRDPRFRRTRRVGAWEGCAPLASHDRRQQHNGRLHRPDRRQADRVGGFERRSRDSPQPGVLDCPCDHSHRGASGSVAGGHHRESRQGLRVPDAGSADRS